MKHATTQGYPFDPTHGYSLEKLLAVQAPEPPADFEAWRAHEVNRENDLLAAKSITF